ncbi:hypothetical protein [Nocardioides sp. Iso805N]|uniref:hypothetical protein n=1 Tax=Nocardioides sp. Iso805N TaxID=1283287 RepID=UPI00036200A6|nr:hypothetical protein [Nocardioides sp. Iso805N]
MLAILAAPGLTASPGDRADALGQMRIKSSKACCLGSSHQTSEEVFMNPYADWSGPLFTGGAIVLVDEFIQQAG